jgi:hypothetical protein
LQDRNANRMILADALGMLETITALRAELAACRLESANRLAAMRAALAADADGECDPLLFLRDEIGDWPPAGRGRC